MTRAEEFHELYASLRIREQRDFYRARRAEYARANMQAILGRNGLLFLAAVAGVLGQITTEGSRSGWAVAGAVLGATAGAVAAYAALVGFPQLEKLYGDAVRNLDEAEVDWDAGGGSDLGDRVERVEGIFRSELGQWGQLVVKDPEAAGRPPPGPAPTDGSPAG